MKTMQCPFCPAIIRNRFWSVVWHYLKYHPHMDFRNARWLYYERKTKRRKA